MRNVGALCLWYKFEVDGNRLSGRMFDIPVFIHGFHPCNLYVCSLPPPRFLNEELKNLSYSEETLEVLNQFLKSAKLL